MSVKIFLSTVSDEFRDYRDQLRSDLTRHNVEVKVQEDFKDYGVVTLDKLDLYISTCDAVVHLVGDMTGSEAKPASTTSIVTKYPDIAEKLPPLQEPLDKGLGISYTQWEAWLALYHGKALLIAKVDAAAPRGPNYTPTAASRAAQQMHLQRLRAVERYPCTFTSPDNLAKQIFSSVILDLLALEQFGKPSSKVPGPPYARRIAVLFLLLLTPLAAFQLTKAFGLTFAVSISILGAAVSLALTLALALVPVLTLALIYLRYVGILGAGAEKQESLERQAYDALRASLATGGLPARLHSRLLAHSLYAVDRRFGDAGMADQTLLQRAFGLRTPAPLWTAPALDRCLLLALIYPVAPIFMFWAISGHVGPAEAALGLKPDLPVWQRELLVTVSVFAPFAVWLAMRTRGWKSLIWLAAAAVADAFALAAAVALAVAVAAALTGVAAVAAAGTVAGAVAVASVVAVAVAFAGASAFAFAFAVAVAFAFAGNIAVAIAALNEFAIRHRWQGIFLLIFLAATTVGCLGAARLLSSMPTWQNAAPVLLFLGLLPLLNAPFAWASLGLTRALLRRGLELAGWWPYLLALADALLAGVIIALLALTMVIGVQAFDALAVHGGGEPVLPLTPLFDGIAAHPEAPEYWWVYALLLSTMIPSLVNLVIGGTALMRAAPGLPSLLLRYLPAGRAVPAFDRAWLALVLTLQVVGGVILGVAAQAVLAVGLISYVMPWLGLGLLDLARDVAAFDLPMRVGQLFKGLF